MANDINSLTRLLDLIKAVSGEKEATVPQLAEQLGCSTRNVYYLLRTLREYGFIVHRHGNLICLDVRSPFLEEISRSVNFSKEQATYLYNLLDSTDSLDAQAGLLKRKIQRFYHLNERDSATLDYRTYHNYTTLKRAISRKAIVELHDYQSSNSQTISDRIVEPYLFLGDNADVRAFEIKSGMNKSFKISRIGSVEILKDNWFNADKHKDVFTDMFLFTGETPLHVCLRLDVAAHNLMLEEYPHSAPLMQADGDNHWIYKATLANYKGIGRFILGLYDHIDVIADDGLKQYLRDRIARLKSE